MAVCGPEWCGRLHPGAHSGENWPWALGRFAPAGLYCAVGWPVNTFPLLRVFLQLNSNDQISKIQNVNFGVHKFPNMA
jgi:hypothetical protein